MIMEDDKKRLMASILHFLRGELAAEYLNSENVEGLEVAIQCLESIYELTDTPLTEPTLMEVYQTFLGSTILNHPDASEEEKKEAELLKANGNAAMTAQLYHDALEYYTRAIKIDGKNAVYYCNRAAAYSKLYDHRSAIRDCKIAIEIDPKYCKAYGRLGLAYTGLEDYERALENYRLAASLDPENEGYRNNVILAERKCAELAQARDNVATGSGLGIPGVNGPGGGIDLNMIFTNPQLLNVAFQMLSDPSMQTMMSTIMAGSLGNEGGMDALLQAGQQLAQQMQSENPALVDQLRQTLGSGDISRQPGNQSPTTNNPNQSTSSQDSQNDKQP